MGNSKKILLTILTLLVVSPVFMKILVQRHVESDAFRQNVASMVSNALLFSIQSRCIIDIGLSRFEGFSKVLLEDIKFNCEGRPSYLDRVSVDIDIFEFLFSGHASVNAKALLYGRIQSFSGVIKVPRKFDASSYYLQKGRLILDDIQMSRLVMFVSAGAKSVLNVFPTNSIKGNLDMTANIQRMSDGLNISTQLQIKGLKLAMKGQQKQILFDLGDIELPLIYENGVVRTVEPFRVRLRGMKQNALVQFSYDLPKKAHLIEFSGLQMGKAFASLAYIAGCRDQDIRNALGRKKLKLAFGQRRRVRICNIM